MVAFTIKVVADCNVILFKLVPVAKEDSVVIVSRLINLVQGGAAQVSHCLLICMAGVKH